MTGYGNLVKSMLRDAVEIFRIEGPVTLFLKTLNYFYRRTFAPFLPTRTVHYNGIKVPSARLFDGTLPWRSCEDQPNYESGLISGLEERLQPGLDVVIVGGGWGVTAVKAAEKVGEAGSVTVYEGSIKEVDRVRRTVETNGYSDTVDVNHAIVGTAINLHGKSGEAPIVNPEELPQCDVLELDCEGSEVKILEELTISPKVILVETHGLYDASTDRVKSILSNRSYSVVSNVIADKGRRHKCVRDDIRVLTALCDDKSSRSEA